MPFDSTPRSFRGARFITTTTLRSDQFFRLVGRRDPRDDLAHFIADVDGSFSSLSAPGNALRRLDLPDAHLDFGEILDRRFSGRGPAGGWRTAAGAGRRGLAAGAAAAVRVLPVPRACWFLFHGFDPFDRFGFIDARENSFRLRRFGSGF